MPELPEVETIVRGLRAKLTRQMISSINLRLPSLLKGVKEADLKKLQGKRILRLRRRGKIIIIECEGDISLLFHLKMTGSLLLVDRKSEVDKHTHLIITLEMKSKELRFRDVRKFGYFYFLPTSKIFSLPPLDKLGPEALEINLNEFLAMFKGRRARIKSLLLNQNFIAGVGNIYADEILFQAKIHPLKPASQLKSEELKRLWTAMRDVLLKAIESKGSSVRNYIDADGRQGRFQDYHQVYGQQGQSCPRCGQKIKRIRLGGRSTFFCSRCQK